MEVKRSYTQLTERPDDELALTVLDRIEAEFTSGSRIFHATIKDSFAKVVELRGHAMDSAGSWRRRVRRQRERCRQLEVKWRRVPGQC